MGQAVLAVWLLCRSGGSSAWGQVLGNRVEISTLSGMAHWDADLEYDSKTLFGMSTALMLGPYLGVEGIYARIPTEARAPSATNLQVSYYGVGLKLQDARLYPIVPYVSGGWSQLEFDSSADRVASSNGWRVGGGIEAWVLRRMAVHFEATDVIFERSWPLSDAGVRHTALLFTGGVRLALGGRLPHTTASEINTEINRQLAEKYQTNLDSDHDGVCDRLDRSADTPRGAVVDVHGVPVDSDGDGVFDGLDLCEGTPADVKVDRHGCPIEVREKELQFLNVGTLCFEDVVFDKGSAEMKPEYLHVLNEVGEILLDWPSLKIEVGGHTSAEGPESENSRLSLRRARTILEHLIRQVPKIDATRLTAVGYGETRSVTSNETEGGRARNRRVEFRVLNREILTREEDRRRFLMKNEK
jgi:outer membrane protein OmpA-like peptidoglycan-associated protein